MKRRRRFRFLLVHQRPHERLIQGVLSFPLFWLLQTPLALLLATIYWAWIATLSGRRINFLHFFFFVLSVALLNLYPPTGRVLWDPPGFFVVTSVSLVNALNKSFRLIGVVYLSLASVSPDLELPGKIGFYWKYIFEALNQILQKKEGLSRKNLLTDIDALLLKLEETLWNSPSFEKKKEASAPALKKSITIAIVIFFLNWLIFFVNRIESLVLPL